MLPEYFAIVGAIIASIGGLKYVYETLRGRVRPNRIGWFLWGVLPMIIFVAQRAQGVQGLSWVSFVTGLMPLLVVAASFFNKAAYWQTTRRDYVCMGFALVGVFLWMITKTPNLAITFSILADFAAGLPTVIKSYTHPTTESWSAFGISALGFVVSLLSIQSWTFENYAFVIYLTCINVIITVLAARPHVARWLQKSAA